MRKRYLISSICAAALIAAFLCPLHALAKQPSRVVRVGALESETNLELNESGEYVGYSIAYLQDIAYFTEWEYEYVPCTPAEGFKYLEEGYIDLLPMVLRTKEREKLYTFSDLSYGTSSLTLFVKEDSKINEGNYDCFGSPMTVAIANGTQNVDDFKQFAAQKKIEYKIVSCDSLVQVKTAVTSGEVHAGVLSNYQAFEGTRPVARFAPSPYFFAVNKDEPELLEELNSAMRSIIFADPNHNAELFSQYDKNDDNIVTFTQQELEYIKKMVPVRVAFTSFWEPLSVVDEQTQQAGGVVADILVTAFDKASLQYEFVPVPDNRAAYNALINGEADIIGGCIADDSFLDEKGIVCSHRLIDVSILQIFNSSGYGNKALYASTYLPETMQLPGTENLKPVTFKTDEECFEALRNGEVSKIYVNTYSATELLSRSRYSSFESSQIQGASVQIKSAFKADADPMFISIANKAIDAVSTAKKNSIIVSNTLADSNESMLDYLRDNPLAAVVVTSVIFALIFVVILYITGLKQRRLRNEQNKQLQQALEIAKKASNAKGDFMSRMSHEIRTPLNAVIGYNSIARSELSGKKDGADRVRSDMKVSDCLIKSDIASKHLLAVINDVLDMSAIESGSIKVLNERFDFRNLISSLTVLFSSQLRAKGVNFEVIFNTPTQEWYIGDQMRINQVLTNLLSNAVKFTSTGGKVTLSITQLDRGDDFQRLRFEVADTGIGMEKEYLEHIWVPFEQANASISRRFGGTGLGLSISKNLVDLMGGTIDVESEKDVGSTFTVELSLGCTQQPDFTRTYNFSDMKALVVDDEPGTCEYMKLLFDRYSIQCQTVCSGEEAVRLAKAAEESRESFTICIVDWRMPEMDGLETVRRLRECISDARMPAIIMTAYDSTEVEADAEKLGISTIASKPLFQSTLFDLLASVGGFTSGSGGDTDVKYDFSGRRILLVEDNEMNMEIAVDLMSEVGFNVDCAWNGKQAVESFNSSAEGYYDLILMDVHMPIMDGHEAARKIRESSHPQSKTVPILAMTADAFAENVREALDSGMNDHIAKPIDVNRLFAKLQKYLNE